MADEAKFSYKEDESGWKNVETVHKLAFRLDHFTGARFGLFIYSTIVEGGEARFSDFIVN